MAKILDKPLDNVSVPGEGVVKKNELRAILKNISVQIYVDPSILRQGFYQTSAKQNLTTLSIQSY